MLTPACSGVRCDPGAPSERRGAGRSENRQLGSGNGVTRQHLVRRPCRPGCVRWSGHRRLRRPVVGPSWWSSSIPAVVSSRRAERPGVPRPSGGDRSGSPRRDARDAVARGKPPPIPRDQGRAERRRHPCVCLGGTEDRWVSTGIGRGGERSPLQLLMRERQCRTVGAVQQFRDVACATGRAGPAGVRGTS